MKKVSVVVLCLALSLFAAFSATADTIHLGSGYLATYANAIVGPISGSSLNSNPIAGGITCVDPANTSYLGSSWEVYVSTLDPLQINNTRYGLPGEANYKKAALLLGQIPTHTSDVGEIQFAIWRIFDQAYITNNYGSSGRDIAGEDAWMAWAASAVLISGIDYTSVRIYTPTSSANQEFMSGSAAVPLPGAILLLGAGMARLIAYARRRQD